MRKAYMITEGKSGADILRAVLPEGILRRTEFIVGDGRYSAQSLARSVLAAEQAPAALVLDADTSDPAAVQEQIEFLRYSLIQASPDTESEAFLAVPETEILLVQDMDFIKKLSGRSDMETEFAGLHPKKFLLNTLKGDMSSYPEILRTVLDRLDCQTVRTMRKHPLISQLGRFLVSITGGDLSRGKMVCSQAVQFEQQVNIGGYV